MLRMMISPAKKMKLADEIPIPVTAPLFLERTERLKQYLQGLDDGTLQAIWKCNDKIAAQNVGRLRDMELKGRTAPAVMAYDGIQYQSMAPSVMSEEELAYIGGHLYILSGFYGILRAFDGVVPYRLEMQAKLDWDCGGEWMTSLYDYWGDRLYRVLTAPPVGTDPFGDASAAPLVGTDTSGGVSAAPPIMIINLASKEYSKAIEPWLQPQDTMVTCVFGEEQDGKVKVKATAAKMARGSMVRYLAQRQAETVEEVKGFGEMGYQYQERFSDAKTLVFTKKI